jgi:cysteine synthase
MKKIYVVGVGTGLSAVGKAKEILELKEDVEIICVGSRDDIPFKERLKSDPSIIREIHKFSAPQMLPAPTYFDTNKKIKGHQRPYKFHK